MGYKLINDSEISLVMPSWHEGTEEYFEIILNKTNEPVGFIEFKPKIDKIIGNIEYGVFPEYRGNGYAKKALNLFVIGIKKITSDNLYLSIHPDNTASIKIAKDAGGVFERYALIPKNHKFSENGKYKYAYMYIIKNKGNKDEKNKSK